MTETGRRNFPKRMHMRIYLYRGCDGLRQYIQMMKWIHHEQDLIKKKTGGRKHVRKPQPTKRDL